MAVRIGELLLKEKRITPAQLQEALNYQKTNGGKLGDEPRQAGIRQGRGDHRAPEQPVRRALDRSLAVRDRHRGHQAGSSRDRPEVPGRAAQPSRRHADDRDDRPDQRVRHGRHQVHDGLQRRAGRGLRERRRSRRSSSTTPPRSAERRPTQTRGPRRRGRCQSSLEMVDQGARGTVASSRRRRRGAGGARGNRRRGAGEAGRRGAGHPHGEHGADVGDPEGRQRHPHRAVRERVPHPVPHRRHPLQHHAAADEVPGRDHLAPEDHGEARHRREAAAAGRPHQDPLQRQRTQARRSTSASRASRRCSARRSCSDSSTRTS